MRTTRTISEVSSPRAAEGCFDRYVSDGAIPMMPASAREAKKRPTREKVAGGGHRKEKAREKFEPLFEKDPELRKLADGYAKYIARRV